MPKTAKTSRKAGKASEPVSTNRSGVLIVAAECAPLAKTGGLADVVGALPKYLARLGIDARVIMPYHSQIKRMSDIRTEHLCDFTAQLGWRKQYAGIERATIDGTVFYFVDNEFYFGGPVYCGGEFEGEQYSFFTRAVLEAIPRLDFTPQVVHCNDWHTAMIPALARTQYAGAPQNELKYLLTIHNLAYQGRFSSEFMADLLGLDPRLRSTEFAGHYGSVNMLKGGIVFSDLVNTVSPTYAREITTPSFGETLDGVLRSRGDALSGVLNGIDTDVWNPEHDPHIAKAFMRGDLSGKLECKLSLLDELGLDASAAESTPLIAMVGRLTPQKGVDLVCSVIDRLMAENVRVCILGSGDRAYEEALRAAEDRHRGFLCSYIGYNAALSHRIYAGSDLFLMPSAFEPCGISQMIAMRYASLPIVRETGGLCDTVIPYNRFSGEGTGFSFANYDARDMLSCIERALSCWHDEPARAGLIDQAMACDFGFDRCARAYAELYKALCA